MGGGMEEGRRNCQSLLLLLLSPFQVIHASESAAGRRRSEILRRENSERGKDAPKILTPKTLQELCRFFSLTPPHRSGEEPRADHIFPRLQKPSRRKREVRRAPSQRRSIDHFRASSSAFDARDAIRRAKRGGGERKRLLA